MKPRVLIQRILLFITVILSVHGYGFELSVGGRVGVNIASILGDTTTGVFPKVGLTGGLFTTLWINKSLYVQPELLLGLKGETAAKNENIKNPEYATSLSYFEIPVLCGWKFIANDPFQVMLYAGAIPAINLSAETADHGVIHDTKDLTKSFDCGITAGFTVWWKRNQSFVPIDIRYVLGLIPFNDDKVYPPHLYNGAFSLTLGFGLDVPLKKEERF